MLRAQWDVWIADVRFDEDPSKSKLRPVIVLIPGMVITLSLKGTSHNPRDEFPGEYTLERWKDAGLQHETTIRRSMPLQLEERDFKYRIGTLHPSDRRRLSSILEKMPWFQK